MVQSAAHDIFNVALANTYGIVIIVSIILHCSVVYFQTEKSYVATLGESVINKIKDNYFEHPRRKRLEIHPRTSLQTNMLTLCLHFTIYI